MTARRLICLLALCASLARKPQEQPEVLRAAIFPDAPVRSSRSS